MKIVIVLPAYNAEKTLMQTLAEIPEEYTQHVILVDDASRDHTVDVATQAGIQVFVHPKNLGYGDKLIQGGNLNDTAPPIQFSSKYIR